ncbi:hypothetical protein QTA58_00035 [Neorhizobium sp. CSC1952]|nr:hypothetical protein [Rhizobium sp. CSC1952]WJR69608.1 hypothetical protein QTA58_00035 [Rhizobium sp. CSC1952]
MEGWRKVVAQLAARHRIAGRVVFIEKGDLGRILKRSRGVVIVNSTTGLQSLRLGIPTIALGSAIYNVRGLTHQDGLDSFWRHPEAIDTELLADFVKALAGTIQVKGNFYHEEGRKVAIETIVARVAGEMVNQPDAYVERPPRLSWRRLPPMPGRSAQSSGILSGTEIFVGGPEPALSVGRFADASDPRNRNPG